MFYEPLEIVNLFKTIKGQKTVKKLPKIKPENLKNIQDLTNAFNTKWCNITPSVYFETGLKLWKSFSYSKFLDKKVLTEYIKKNKKWRRRDFGIDDIKDSFKHIELSQYTSLYQYCNDKVDNICLPVYDYIHHDIDKILMSYILYKKLVTLNEIELMYVDSIVQDKKNTNALIKRFSRTITKLDRRLKSL